MIRETGNGDLSNREGKDSHQDPWKRDGAHNHDKGCGGGQLIWYGERKGGSGG